ncbi:tRNA (adenosine(37)-N6)-threonylcarbamoyltransferase complex ATPase subunit type 1 TsaE [Bauldia litoralis]|uniref:tRNA threonylcarbamoyladenosine biosynthesis protein TsaE n=1 Tax=Bauldia litoralis TaxID=665467 RepID=A0A1G6EGN2_9HYPH|nr:tRNA (adenosine(37)-N6)-threonylcarbamoyltransferase complex ATPase subunit type 1 TsaE [Bauldia litoralis]SDB56601.1 hypothetical protein SAMN02982931_04499 [Bauldia litoralis]
MAATRFPLTLDLADETATTRFAEDIAACLAPGDVIALSGGLGVGKTTFARALIRALADDAELEVPSPTFTLAQSYASGPVPVTHFDLYRLSSPEELDELGLEEALATGAALIEWPERAEDELPPTRLTIAFAIAGDGRAATLSGSGDWQRRIAHSRHVRAFLDTTGFSGAARRYLQGDASSRTYERIRAGDRHAVLMDWPPAEAPAAGDRRGAYRARDVRAFVAVDEALRDAGLSAPAVLGADLDGGLLVLEDLGSTGIAVDGEPVAERYHAAIGVLATIHGEARPDTLPAPDGGTHRLPAYSADALAAELDLFLDWYVPHVTGAPAADAARQDFAALWADLTGQLAAAETSWVLLDYHSPNLLWLADRAGLARVGILDFQDMLTGPVAYDVVSLCQDARVTVPPALESSLVAAYVALRQADKGRFDDEAFAAVYAILGAQRATKILGAFARLADHTGKPRYLQHIPRLREYLKRSLAHPALTGYAQWYRRHLPPSA